MFFCGKPQYAEHKRGANQFALAIVGVEVLVILIALGVTQVVC